jgi:hypothetical protein
MDSLSVLGAPYGQPVCSWGTLWAACLFLGHRMESLSVLGAPYGQPVCSWGTVWTACLFLWLSDPTAREPYVGVHETWYELCLLRHIKKYFQGHHLKHSGNYISRLTAVGIRLRDHTTPLYPQS